MKWDTFIALLSTVLPLFVAFITFLLKFIKNEKAKKVLQQTVKITEILQQFIIDAESYKHFTGAEKKEFVLTKVNRFAIDNNMKFDQDKVSEMIDELVATTKKVNMREKDRMAVTQETNLPFQNAQSAIPLKTI